MSEARETQVRAPEVVRGDGPCTYSLRQDFGAVDALLVAAIDMVAETAIQWSDGNEYWVKQGFLHTAGPNDGSAFPCVTAHVRGEIAYADTPGGMNGPDGTRFVYREITVPLRIRLTATNDTERAAIMQVVEAAFMPDEDKYSVRVQMPFYFGMPAEFVLRNVELEERAAENQWFATFSITASGMQVVNRGAPTLLKPSLEFEFDMPEAEYPVMYPRMPPGYDVSFYGFRVQS